MMNNPSVAEVAHTGDGALFEVRAIGVDYENAIAMSVSIMQTEVRDRAKENNEFISQLKKEIDKWTNN